MIPVIKEPCNKNWNDLHPNSQGAFCNACSKTVIDFTEKTNEEILAYLSQSTEKVCGRMAAPKPKMRWHWAAAALIFAPFIGACNWAGKKLTGEIVVQPNFTDSPGIDSPKCSPKMGKIVSPQHSPYPDTPVIDIMGDIEMGEVATDTIDMHHANPTIMGNMAPPINEKKK
jgi:hypothetical protein